MRPAATPAAAVDHGLTDPLDPLADRVLGGRLVPLLELVDANAGIRVDGIGVELRRVLRRERVRWEHVDRITLDSRLDVGLAFAVRFLPVRRVPLVGGMLVSAAQGAVGTVTSRVAPGLRDSAGWVVATLHRPARLRRDVDVDGGPALAGLLHADVAEVLVAFAEERGIPVERR